MTVPLYKLNIKKLEEACSQNLFGTTNLSAGSLPREIEIDESQDVHFVQILFILKEKFWKSNQWALFTKRDLENWIYADKSVYLENTPSFGAKFFAGFTAKSKVFIERYCDKFVG